MRVLGDMVCIQPGAGVQVLKHQWQYRKAAGAAGSAKVDTAHPTLGMLSLLVGEVHHDSNEVAHVQVIIDSRLQHQCNRSTPHRSDNIMAVS